MASTQFIIIAILALSISVSAKEFIVGDDSGWTIYFDYQSWAQGKEFVVGDKLVFNYPVGDHNVFKVNGTAFQECTKPPPSEALTTGNDVITLATPGRKWYICGVGQHCQVGNQKLAITVLPQSVAPAPEPFGNYGSEPAESTYGPVPSPMPAVWSALTMASTQFIIIAILALSISVSAKEFIVGDDSGWTIYFDYQSWAQGKEFVVGDKLVFNYLVGDHNVFKVNGTAFQECTKPPPSEALTTGNDVITLATPGRKWYICGVGQHCQVGNQKLAITVLPQSVAPAPEPFGNYASEPVESSYGPMPSPMPAVWSARKLARN
ncbi:blue copper protein-like [Cornus florida]|uniref:blue copper protein-like n=1 Tax=Cornus florida TaxID=4283 RepID=UPI0028A2476B|nr:blue copper protein-like [Cornus florida]